MDLLARPSDLLGQWTALVGEVNAGKTTLTRRVLTALLDLVGGPRIVVLDLAPAIPAELAAARGLTGVGGRLLPPPQAGVLYLHPSLLPPRLTAPDEARALALAEANRLAIEPELDRFAASGRDVLVINDLSLYLQAGRASELIKRLASAKTLVANGYLGERLGRGEISRRERSEMATFLERCRTVVRLPAGGAA